MPSRSVLVFAALAFALGTTPAFAERVIIKCQSSCDAVVQAVETAGGTVTHRYKYVKAVAADVPSGSLSAVRKVAGEAAVRKDLMVQTELSAKDPRTGAGLFAETEAQATASLGVEALAARADAEPQAYLINNAMTGVNTLHADNLLGQEAVVAVLDSGIRPGFPHLTFDNSVIGGENFVQSDSNGFSNSANNGHGTVVAGMISANVQFNFAGHPWQAIIASECPSCITPEGVFTVLGSAPSSSIYAMRVLDSEGSGATSWIIAGMERVIDLRRAFDAGATPTKDASGKYNALPIRVANMSLGGTTLLAGRDIEDELTNAFLENDIVLVVAAGNQGPGGSTIGSPGSGVSSLAVGAASTAVHERILRKLQLGPVLGGLFRPFSGTQMASFSSRGPTADGRVTPAIVASGLASFGAGTGGTGSITISSGTSFASPTVAGIAAVLRQAVPQASARQVHNALIASANPAGLQDGSGPLDRGAGFVNAAAARALLEDWTSVSDAAPGRGVENKNVNVNILQGADVKTWSGDVTRSVSDLLPGQRFETFYKVTPNTAAVEITVSGVVPGAAENALFGDDIFLTVHSSKTSAIGPSGDYKVAEITTGGTFTVANPDQGIMRITLNGDSTNASPIAATVTITSIKAAEPGLTLTEKIADGQVYAVPFTVLAGAKQLTAKVEWDGDWSNYPTNDLDMILQRPDGTLVQDGATLNAPERASIKDPAAGNWIAYVEGFTVSTKGGDRFKLQVVVDGQVVK
jgi:subtilisin family serine protease